MVDPSDHDSTHWSVISGMHDGRPGDTWDRFIRRYEGYVAGMLRHAGLRATEVEAACAEFWSYLYLSRAVTRADRNGRFRSFLAGVVRNYARDWLRRQQRTEQPATDSVLDALPDRQDVEVDLFGVQLLHLALSRLAQQHPDSETALRLFYGIAASPGGDGPPPARASVIAERLASNTNAVHQLLLRARRQLRREIEREVARTVGNSPDLREELLLLLGAIERYKPGLVDPPPTAA